MLSGDGQWFSQSAQQNASAWLTTWNLDSADENAVDLAVTTGIDGLSFDNDVSPDANFDGSSTAIVARSGSYRDLAMVVNPAGIEIARMSGPDEYGSEAWFEKEIFIDASGRYVTFTSNATRLTPVINGVTKPRSSTLEGWNSAFRLDIQTGEINLVAIKPGGAELQDYTYALGISDGGRYVLFKSSATNLPGATGEMQVYLRDMSSTAASSIILVSVDESGTPITTLACCQTVPDISDDGSRVVYTENSRTSSDGKLHTFLWTRDTGSSSLAGSAIELTTVTGDRNIRISGDGRWLAGDSEEFSRLEIDTGITDPRPDANGAPVVLDDLKISANGEVIVFWNNELTTPDGEDGRWWALRYAAGPAPDTTDPQWPGGAALNLVQGPNNVQISWPEAIDDTAVTQYVVYRDDVEIAEIDAPTRTHTDTYDVSGTYVYSVEAKDAAGNESSDGPTAGISVDYLPAVVILISETIIVSDETTSLLGIEIAISETISVSDDLVVLPSMIIEVSETIAVTDDDIVIIHPTLADTIKISLPDGPLVPGATFTADAGGFKPFTPVQAFLQSEPVLVGTETADAVGNVSFQITIPTDFPPGEHTLVLLGQDPDGLERRLTAAIDIEAPILIFENSFE